jgi:hypothetical protein
MTKKNEMITAMAVATAQAAKSLTAWTAVEAHAKRLLEDVKETTEISGDFAEIHFVKDGVKGVIKAGNVVLKIDR